MSSTHFDPHERIALTRKVTVWGLVVNLLLSIFKFLIGLISGSQALIADSVHSLSDSATDVAVLVGAPYWSAPADRSHPHGHGRIETLITALIGVMLALVGIGLGYHALATIGQPKDSIPGWSAFIAALVSIGSKEALYRWNRRVGLQLRSSALVANAWHHRSDGLSSVPVAVAVLGEHIYPAWHFLDPVAALLVSILIFHAAYRIVRPALEQLCDVGVETETYHEILDLAREIDGVRTVHALRSRNVGSGWQVDLHVQVDAELTVQEGHDIAGRVKQHLLEKGTEIVDVLVHIEPYLPDEEKTP